MDLSSDVIGCDACANVGPRMNSISMLDRTMTRSTPNAQPQVYRGTQPFAFVSYSHADAAAMDAVRALTNAGKN